MFHLFQNSMFAEKESKCKPSLPQRLWVVTWPLVTMEMWRNADAPLSGRSPVASAVSALIRRKNSGCADGKVLNLVWFPEFSSVLLCCLFIIPILQREIESDIDLSDWVSCFSTEIWPNSYFSIRNAQPTQSGMWWSNYVTFKAPSVGHINHDSLQQSY